MEKLWVLIVEATDGRFFQRVFVFPSEEYPRPAILNEVVEDTDIDLNLDNYDVYGPWRYGDHGCLPRQ